MALNSTPLNTAPLNGATGAGNQSVPAKAATSPPAVMRQRLLNSLPRGFRRTPSGTPALRVRYDGAAMRWTIADGVFTTVVTGGFGAALSADLSAYSVTGFAGWLDSQVGYQVAWLTDDPDVLGRSALALADGGGDQDASGGGLLGVQNSLLWAVLSAWARELARAAAQVPALIAQVSLATAEGDWQDLHGEYYAVPRLPGESDVTYRTRIIAETLAPRGNNVVIADSVRKVAGLAPGEVTVPDAPLHPANSYGLFDVVLAVTADYLAAHDLTALFASVAATVDKLRDAGTHLRAARVSTESAGPLVSGLGLVYGDSVTVYPYAITAAQVSGPMPLSALATTSSATITLYPKS